MHNRIFPSFLLATASIVGCGQNNAVQPEEALLPEADLSVQQIDFGEVEWGDAKTREVMLTNDGDLPMGVSDILLIADGLEENFTLSFDTETLSCPDSDETARKRANPDTATGGGSDTELDTGGSGGEEDDSNVFIMDAGCELPIQVSFVPVVTGEVHGSFSVETVLDEETEDASGISDPLYYRDPDGFKKVVLLEGTAIKGQGNIVVTPRTLDMGHLWTTETNTQYISIMNVGDGDLTLDEPSIESDCTSFTMDTANFDDDGVLPAESSTVIAVDFAPESLDAEYCTITITSDDEDTPEIEVSVQGNAGSDPENEPPSVTLHSPSVGYQHTSGSPIVLELSMFDINQPADTLFCKVKSAVLQEIKLADCTPEDESGNVTVEIETELLDAGVDTFLVTVTDQSEKQAYASTTVLWMSGYPESDDDGDGFGDDDDCDDSDSNTYPKAAEIHDGYDNDCDGAVDEKTLGSDDDGDAISEADGDCDDDDNDTYPNAPEVADQKDNDCDGTVDEGTSLYDDDEDGFSELDNDCDDSDPTINPAQVELCDGIDNNCNGLRDDQEDCEEITSEPLIIGGIRMSQTAIGVGESTTMMVEVFDEDGQDITYTWQEDQVLTGEGHTSIDNISAAAITWTAPSELPSGDDGEIFNVTVVISDEDGNQDWIFDEITVYSEPVLLYQNIYPAPDMQSSGCSDDTPDDYDYSMLVPCMPLLAFSLARRRRKQTKA